MLICENITCKRGESIIFRQLGFCLQENSLLLLKGPNGSGKTSLLEILSGELKPAEGQVLWEGKPIQPNNPDMMVIRHNETTSTKTTVYDYLMAQAKLYDTRMLVPAALKFYDLLPFRDMPTVQLSMGWQRRLALAKLIVAPCKLWLLDEPTDFLDEDSVLLTASLIETRVRQGGIVIAASHSLRSGLGTHALDMTDFRPNPET
jgi:heme exporter protein A